MHFTVLEWRDIKPNQYEIDDRINSIKQPPPESAQKKRGIMKAADKGVCFDGQTAD
jgi:hypothetical protein